MARQELLMKKLNNCFTPYGDVAWETFDLVQSKEPILVTIQQARNPDHHNKLWALAGKVADFDDSFTNAEAAVRWAKRRIPEMHKRYRDVDGSLVIELESISFANMDQIQFSKVYDQVLFLWAERLECDPETLLDEDKFDGTAKVRNYPEC